MSDLWASLCLVAVLEGLLLFAFPAAWKRTAERMQAMDNRGLRTIGAVLLAAGLLALYVARQAT
jgi:uncharacterized protein YjeT (DUF2065 family)